MSSINIYRHLFYTKFLHFVIFANEFTENRYEMPLYTFQPFNYLVPFEIINKWWKILNSFRFPPIRSSCPLFPDSKLDRQGDVVVIGRRFQTSKLRTFNSEHESEIRKKIHLAVEWTSSAVED